MAETADVEIDGESAALQGDLHLIRHCREVLTVFLPASAPPRSAGQAAPPPLPCSCQPARTKRVVSRDRLSLNDDHRLAQKFSQRIDGGWWVFTNNSFDEAKKFILRAAFHAGLSASVERAA